jgi:hypothetical protein
MVIVATTTAQRRVLGTMEGLAQRRTNFGDPDVFFGTTRVPESRRVSFEALFNALKVFLWQ